LTQPPSTSENPNESDPARLAREFNDSVLGLRILYDSAKSGSGAARQMLSRFSDELVEEAGRYGPREG